MTETVLISLLAMSVRMAVPYWFSSLGEMYSQKSGVLNIGLEGVITVGAFVSFMVAFYSGSCWLGLAAAVAACVVLGLIYGLLVIYLGMDQPITGIALNLLILGSTSFLYRLVFGTTAIAPTSSSTFDKVAIPLLSKIPWLGEILFHQYAFVYLAVVLLIFSVYFFRRTKAGIVIIACGENPSAAETRGVGVNRVRLLCVMVSAAFSAVAGMYLSLAQLSSFSVDMVAGRGYIAFALVIFGKWNAENICIGALLFGFLEALALTLQASASVVPYQFLLMLPYAFTVLALIVTTFKRRSARPSCLGVRYRTSR